MNNLSKVAPPLKVEILKSDFFRFWLFFREQRINFVDKSHSFDLIRCSILHFVCYSLSVIKRWLKLASPRASNFLCDLADLRGFFSEHSCFSPENLYGMIGAVSPIINLAFLCMDACYKNIEKKTAYSCYCYLKSFFYIYIVSFF